MKAPFYRVVAGIPLLIVLLMISAILPLRHSTAQKPESNRQLSRDRTHQASGFSGRRIALVIGNGGYTTAPPLKNRPNDARDMAATLKTLGFEVASGVNVNQQDMKRLIREFGLRLRGGGSGLFYYAGHGVQSKGHNYLIPVDADIQSEAEVEDSGVDVSLVLNFMEDAQNGLNFVILDACRDNPFARSFRSTTNGLAQVDAPTGTLIAYATAPGRVASDGLGQNGLYTSELLKQMRVPGLSATDMFMHVRAEVMKQTANKQVPWEASSLVGRFYFSATNSNAEANTTSGPTSISEAAKEQALWEAVKESNDPHDLKDYLAKYPNGAYVAAVQVKLRQLEAAKTSLVGSPSATVPNGPIDGRTKPQSFRYMNKYLMEFVLIPAGRFNMGSINGQSDQKPLHEVSIMEPFYMGKYEVTQGQWRAVMGTTLRQQRDKVDPSWKLVGEGENYPMYYVSWEDAQSFVRLLNELNDGYLYRLPTEAEWEYACRAGTAGDYSGDLDSIAWYGNNSGSYIDEQGNFSPDLKHNNRSHQVGTKRANSFGLSDMHGNVWEWCEDWYHVSYDGAPNDGSAWLSGGEQKERVLRGGSWGDHVTINLRSAFRVRNPPEVRNESAGFRVVAIMRTR